MGTVTAGWAWWAGRNEEWMTVGPEPTRDDAIAQGMDDVGEGEGDFIVLEAVMHEISLSASSVLENAYENWCDGDMFSHEYDSPEPQGTKEDQQAGETELQALLNGWVAKWRHILPTPNMFAATRNQETIRNTVDPDMLPGGHDVAEDEPA